MFSSLTYDWFHSLESFYFLLIMKIQSLHPQEYFINKIATQRCIVYTKIICQIATLENSPSCTVLFLCLQSMEINLFNFNVYQFIFSILPFKFMNIRIQIYTQDCYKIANPENLKNLETSRRPKRITTEGYK